MKKKLIKIFLIMTVAINLLACGSTETDNNSEVSELKAKIAEQEAQIADLQKQLAESQQETDTNDDTSNVSASIDETTAETWGVCGADLTWYYQNGTLVIRGTGDMSDYNYYSTKDSNRPWEDIIDKIHWVYIEDGVTSIGQQAFEYHSLLSKVEIPSSVTIIKEEAFHGCSNLTSITIPESVTKIEDSAFENSALTTSITIPNSVEFIGQSAFRGCDNLEEVIILNAKPALAPSSFAYTQRVIIGGTETTWEEYVSNHFSFS